MSDFSDSDTESDPIDEKFHAAAEHMQKIHTKLSMSDLLELYGLYKQATIGPCNTSKPNIYAMTLREKWNAWKQLGNMASKMAKSLYIEKLANLDPSFHQSLENAKKINASNWVVHSVEMPPEDINSIPENEKNAFDFVKEGDLIRLKQSISNHQLFIHDDNGMGLIHWATDRNYVEILQFLLESGADVNYHDAEKQTALHYAASCGHIDCLRILLNANADRYIKNADGQTCLDLAYNEEVLALLQN